MKKQQTLDKTKSKYTIDQFNIDDEVEFMCIGIEATGKVTSISTKNNHLTVICSNKMIYNVYLSKADSHFFYLI